MKRNNEDTLITKSNVKYYYIICFIQSAHAGLIPDEDDLVNDLHLLFDFDTDTCVDVEETIFAMEFIRINVVIAQQIEGGLVRVYFKHPVMCRMRKVSLNFINLLYLLYLSFKIFFGQTWLQ